ncbi:MAG: amidohydrolase, partial [Spirochaetales bacterium]|nr:amidohydrolase [Spirochaetales bacterium]
MTDYLSAAFEIEEYLNRVRETLHRYPEEGNSEYFTSEFLEAELKSLGLDVDRILGTALVAVLHGGKPGKRVALRADMDALPVTEATGCSFTSENNGMMHACGHDIHMTAALGAAKLLASKRNDLKGDIVFLFQPDEEGKGGAQRMIEAGAVEGVKAVFGGHVSPDLPLGTVGIRYGKFYAASDVITVKVHGKSCHGATPEKGADALLAAVEMIEKLSALKPSSGDRAVLTIGEFRSGTACNIIADEAVFRGIVRTLGNADREEMRCLIKAVTEEVSERYNVKSELELSYSYGGVVNTDTETALMEESAVQVLGQDHVVRIQQPT